MGLLRSLYRWWTAGYRCDDCGQWKTRRSGKAVPICTLAGLTLLCHACAEKREAADADS